jgi:hypothetical protein
LLLIFPNFFTVQVCFPEDDEWPEGLIFAGSIDGVHFKTYEPMHPDLPLDPKAKSHKFNSGGLAYDIFLSIHEQRIYHIGGPYLAGANDKRIWKEGAGALLPDGMRAIADTGYRGSKGVSIPDGKRDSKLANVFKRRVRGRHETFNGRIKNFAILRETFRIRKDRMMRHKTVLGAICVIVQYQMENGSPLFAV